jgi:hypothetical protein
MAFFLAAMVAGALSTRAQQPAPRGEMPRPSVQLSPAEIELYKRAPTLTHWTPREMRESPFFHKLRPAASQDQLPMVLARVGQTVAALLHDFPEVSCDERVVCDAVPGAAPPQELEFRYIVVPRPSGDIPGFDEYRTNLGGKPLGASSLSDLFMITSNFVSTGLFFGTANQPGSDFRLFGIEAIRDRQCQVVGFAEKPERAQSVGAFLYRGKPSALLFQGLAWIDVENSQILRVITWLLAPRPDISLASLTSTVDFFPLRPEGSERVLWLPRDVEVEGVSRGKQFRNTHHYSNFKLFRVESTIKPAG